MADLQNYVRMMVMMKEQQQQQQQPPPGEHHHDSEDEDDSMEAMTRPLKKRHETPDANDGTSSAVVTQHNSPNTNSTTTQGNNNHMDPLQRLMAVAEAAAENGDVNQDVMRRYSLGHNQDIMDDLPSSSGNHNKRSASDMNHNNNGGGYLELEQQLHHEQQLQRQQLEQQQLRELQQLQQQNQQLEQLQKQQKQLEQQSSAAQLASDQWQELQDLQLAARLQAFTQAQRRSRASRELLALAATQQKKKSTASLPEHGSPPASFKSSNAGLLNLSLQKDSITPATLFGSVGSVGMSQKQHHRPDPDGLVATAERQTKKDALLYSAIRRLSSMGTGGGSDGLFFGTGTTSSDARRSSLLLGSGLYDMGTGMTMLNRNGSGGSEMFAACHNSSGGSGDSHSYQDHDEEELHHKNEMLRNAIRRLSSLGNSNVGSSGQHLSATTAAW